MSILFCGCRPPRHRREFFLKAVLYPTPHPAQFHPCRYRPRRNPQRIGTRCQYRHGAPRPILRRARREHSGHQGHSFLPFTTPQPKNGTEAAFTTIPTITNLNHFPLRCMRICVQMLQAAQAQAQACSTPRRRRGLYLRECGPPLHRHLPLILIHERHLPGHLEASSLPVSPAQYMSLYPLRLLATAMPCPIIPTTVNLTSII
jgi:hypothetical protein